MDKKNKLFFAVMTILIAGSIFFTYWRIVIRKDYIIEMQADCDPETEKCFVWECDPESKEEGEVCVGDEEKDIWYYKIVRNKAFNIPYCDPEEDESCDPYSCEGFEGDCEEIFCNEETKEDQGVACSYEMNVFLNNSQECEGDGESCQIEESSNVENEEVVESSKDQSGAVVEDMDNLDQDDSLEPTIINDNLE